VRRRRQDPNGEGGGPLVFSAGGPPAARPLSDKPGHNGYFFSSSPFSGLTVLPSRDTVTSRSFLSFVTRITS
jgi:hypothetical protein